MKNLEEIIDQCNHLPQEHKTVEDIMLEKALILQDTVKTVLASRSILTGLRFYVEFFKQSPEGYSQVSDWILSDPIMEVRFIAELAVSEILHSDPRVKKWELDYDDNWIIISIQE